MILFLFFYEDLLVFEHFLVVVTHYKLFLWLITWFLMYLVLANQVLLTEYIPQANQDSYQIFLSNHGTVLLSIALFCMPFLGIIFMLNSRLSFYARKKSISQILLGLMLPIFLIGILASLAKSELLSESDRWQSVFRFFSKSGIYSLFETLPWAIFLLLIFLIFYKSLFILSYSFALWLYREVFLWFFKSWNKEKKQTKNSSWNHEEQDEEEI